MVLLLVSAEFTDKIEFWTRIEESRWPHSHIWYLSAGRGLGLLCSLAFGLCGRQKSGPQKISML